MPTNSRRSDVFGTGIFFTVVTHLEIHTYLRLIVDLHTIRKNSDGYICFDVGKGHMELEYVITYLVSQCRLYKMAAAKPKINVPQFCRHDGPTIPMGINGNHFLQDVRVQEAEFNYLPRERK